MTDPDPDRGASPGGTPTEIMAEVIDLAETLASRTSMLDEQIDDGREPDVERLREAFRAVHTIKGTAGLAGNEHVHALAHELEEALDAACKGRIALGPALLDVMYAAAEAFPRVLAAPASAEALGVPELRARILVLAGGEPPPTAAPPLHVDASILSALTEFEEHRLRESLRQGRTLYCVQVVLELADMAERIDTSGRELKTLGEVIAYVPSADPTSDDRIAFDILVGSDRSPQEIADVLTAGTVHVLQRPPAPVVTTPAPAVAEPPTAGAPDDALADSTVRVGLSRLDDLMHLVGELGVVGVNLEGILDELRALPGAGAVHRALRGQVRAMSRQLGQLQQGLLDVRMVPLRTELERLAGSSRTLGRQRGKRISPRISGADTELDKVIVQRLHEALLHLLNNAIDHGIESPEERVAAGKPAAGTVAWRAFERGNRVVLEFEDDGRGMDWRKNRDVAVRKGLLTPEAAAELGEAESIDLIYLPGFTTTHEVSGSSGRAIGMDIVKTRVSELSGTIDIDTQVGRGTKFSIVLPVTLAIIQALVVACGRQTFCIPLGSVLESIMVRHADLGTVEGHAVVSLRGRTLPLVELSRLFDLGDGSPYADPDRIYVVIVGVAQHRVGLVVDDLLGQHDVVIKPLGSVLRAVPGIAGATELGANRTVLLLDVAALVDEAVARPDSVSLPDPPVT